MSVYSVSMWLTCQTDDADILKAFDARWTGDLQRAWGSLVVEASSLSDLAVALNKQIYTDCGGQIALDLGIVAGVGMDGVDAFKGTSWQAGSGGLHESGPVPVDATKAGVYVNYWKFPAPNTKTGKMSAACKWMQVSVIGVGGAAGRP